MVFARSDRQVVRDMARFIFSLATRSPCHYCHCWRKMLEHVFAGETAVAAGNGCIGCLGVLSSLLGDRGLFAEVDSWRTHTA
jgi:hypothetical protein